MMLKKQIWLLLLGAYVSLLINAFTSIDPFFFYASITILFILNIFIPISNILIFHTLSFGFMLFLYPLINSYVDIVFLETNFLSILIAAIFLNLLFFKIFSTVNAYNQKLFIAVLLVSIVFALFSKYIAYKRLAGLSLIFCTTLLMGGLCLDGPLFNKKSSKNLSIFLAGLVLCLPVLSLIDERAVSRAGLLESQWCATTTGFKDDYSMKSAYSYSIMREILSNGHSMKWIQNYSEIEAALNQIDILIMLTPVRPFEPKQIALIEKFVARGGTLVAVADHTDLYGHASVLNALLKPFDIRINNDALFKEISQNELIRVSGSNLRDVRIKTPCSVSIFRPSNVWAWANDWISEKGDYSKPNFFGELNWTSDDRVGNWPVGATVKHHSGHVVVFTDSTIFANFAIFQPDYISLLCKIAFPSGFTATLNFYGCILFVIFLLIYLLYGLDQRHLLIVSLLCVVLSGAYYLEDPPDIQRLLPNHLKVFSAKHLIQEVPPSRVPDENHFSTAFANIARSGLYPYYSGESPPSKIDEPYVIITDYEQFAEKFADRIDKNAKVIITSEMSEDNIFKLQEHNYKYAINPQINDFLQLSPEQRSYYIIDRNHTTLYNQTPVLASYGILNDRFIGNWWVNGEISPFRRYILNSFYEWIKTGKDIKAFDYPPIGISESKSNEDIWHFKTDGGRSKDFHIKVKYDQDRMVYCGSGFWALYAKSNEGDYLLGGPELSDDLFTTSMIRWAGAIK